MKTTPVSLWKGISLFIAIIFAFISGNACAEISFVSASNAANLLTTINDNGNSVFVFNGIADGETTDLFFSINTNCPLVAMTGGAEFSGHWSCTGGVISASVTNRGGMSFGPATDENRGSFYVTFSDPPAPPGMDTAPTAFAGTQIAVFGDVERWDLSGESTAQGANFGVELSGPQGGAAHFRMYLPADAVSFLGGVLGITVGGKPDPFAAVTTNSDESSDITVDIASLASAKTNSKHPHVNASTITKKITAGVRVLGVAFDKTSVKTGKSVTLAMCTGTEFTAGESVNVKYSVGGKAIALKTKLTIDNSGCAKASVKLKSVSIGILTAKVSYKGKNAKSTLKVTK